MGAEKGAKCGDSGFSKVIVFDKFFSATLFITVATHIHVSGARSNNAIKYPVVTIGSMFSLCLDTRLINQRMFKCHHLSLYYLLG